MSFAANGRDSKSDPMSHNDWLLLRTALTHRLEETKESFRMYKSDDIIIKHQKRAALQQIHSYYLDCQHRGKHTGTKIQFWQAFCQTFPDFVNDYTSVFPDPDRIAWIEAYNIFLGHVDYTIQPGTKFTAEECKSLNFTAQRRLQNSYDQYRRSSGDDSLSLDGFKQELSRRYPDLIIASGYNAKGEYYQVDHFPVVEVSPNVTKLAPNEYKSNYRELIANDLKEYARARATRIVSHLEWKEIIDTINTHRDLPLENRVQAGYARFLLFHSRDLQQGNMIDSYCEFREHLNAVTTKKISGNQP